MIEFTFLGQHFHLYPARALFWQQARTLVVADVHLGKAATFRAHGIAVPAGTTQSNLARLSTLLIETRAERLLILGDLLHARSGRTDALLDLVTTWRHSVQTLTIDLVLGNHDRHAGLPPASWAIRSVEELIEPPFVWRHEPGQSAAGYVIAGHIHPAVQLRGAGEHLTLPCFYFGHDYALLPAFGEFTGFGLIRPKAHEPVFVLVDDELIPFNQ